MDFRFVWFLCKLFQTTPDDPKITELDPIQKLWMYNHWIADQNEQTELAKHHAYLLGSFWNPEAVKKLVGDDGNNTHISSDEDFEESLKIVEQANKQDNKGKRKRRKIK